MNSSLIRFFTEDEGQGMTEYALIVALVSVALVAGLILFRDEIAAVFTDATTALANR